MNYESMNEASAICMDILVGKPGFPDLAVILYRNGWSTHHVIAERTTASIGGTTALGIRRQNGPPVQKGEFNKQ